MLPDMAVQAQGKCDLVDQVGFFFFLDGFFFFFQFFSIFFSIFFF